MKRETHVRPIPPRAARWLAGLSAMVVVSGSGFAHNHSAGAVESASGETMSISRLLTHADGQPVTPIPPSVSVGMRKSLAHDQVMMFIAGVVDSGEGSRWCIDASGQSRLAVSRDLIDGLRSDPVPTRSAAQALADQLFATYPCGEKKIVDSETENRH